MKTEFKGTKGEWKLVENEYGYYTAVRDLSRTRKICVSRVNNQTESNANLLLISCAPEMLEIIKLMVNEFEYENCTQYEFELIYKARKLIEKATTI